MRAIEIINPLKVQLCMIAFVVREAVVTVLVPFEFGAIPR